MTVLTNKIAAEAQVNLWRNDFPILGQAAYGKPLIYFDNAATSQKPQVVIDALSKYYSEYNANIHRGVHFLSQKASQAFDDVRIKVQQFIHAASEKEIIFTRGTTEGINLVASSWGRKNIMAGDEIIISAMEHHSNIVPWQMLCEEKKAILKVIPMNNNGELLMDEFQNLLSPKTKFISVVHTSNSLGTINPVNEIIRLVRSYSRSIARPDEHPFGRGEGRDEAYIPVMVDGAQAIAHAEIDVKNMDCDFFAFSGHKVFGPTGVGCLYGKLHVLEDMPPYQGGGEMIRSVSFEKTTYNEVPFKFEAGTPNVADVIALGTAIDYVQLLDRNSIAGHEHELMVYASEKLKAIPGVRLIGTAKNKTSVVSFVIDGVNALDAGMYLDTLGVAVRTGHHCTEPVMDFFKIPGTLRASFLFYNSKEEIDVMVAGVQKAISFLIPKS
jgi:cysteine desulfurase/selenocysteine lyase